MKFRQLLHIIPAMDTSDGAGVRLRRSLGSRPELRVDPFLMLDEFGTENPDDYIAGFPSHPHRGFTTVTYMLDGHMQHRDHLGNVGDLGPGAVQWMNAGRGVIHSEMPLQEEGRMRGFQLWINLPAKEKMRPADYRDIAAEQIPVLQTQAGARIKVIAGTAHADGQALAGPISGAGFYQSTDPLYLDIALPAQTTFEHPIRKGHHAFVYVYEGQAQSGEGQVIEAHQAGVFELQGDGIRLTSGAQPARLLLLAAQPIGEPVAQYGPFVMNTREELEQALHDYQNGTLIEPAAQPH